MAGIPIKRLLLYLGVLIMMPLFLALYSLASMAGTLRDAKWEMASMEQRLITQRHRGMRNSATRDKYRGTDPLYLNKRLEPLPLLEEETIALHDLIQHEPSLPNKEVLQRYEFLQSEENRLSFAEGVVQGHGDLRETVERLSHPVEIHGGDLQMILQLIEGEENRPHLLVTDFRLDKKRVATGGEVFLLDIKLLKREYSSSR
jgi:hypothetical protein